MNPRKSRKKYYDMPLHKRKELVKVHLSKELKKKLGIAKRAVVAKKGDKVKIMRGKHKGKEGKIIRVSHKDGVIFIEALAVQTARGQEKAIPFQPSNLMLIELNLDEDRKKKLGVS